MCFGCLYTNQSRCGEQTTRGIHDMEETQKPMDADPKQVRFLPLSLFGGPRALPGNVGHRGISQSWLDRSRVLRFLVCSHTPRRSLILVERGYNLWLKLFFQKFPPLMVLTVLIASSLTALAIWHTSSCTPSTPLSLLCVHLAATGKYEQPRTRDGVGQEFYLPQHDKAGLLLFVWRNTHTRAAGRDHEGAGSFPTRKRACALFLRTHASAPARAHAEVSKRLMRNNFAFKIFFSSIAVSILVAFLHMQHTAHMFKELDTSAFQTHSITAHILCL